MSSDIHKSNFIEAVTNEYSIFTYRFVTAACAVLMTWWMSDLRSETKEIRKDFTAAQIIDEARTSKIEGSVSVINNVLQLQAKIMESQGITLQQHNTRLYELNARIPALREVR